MAFLTACLVSFFLTQVFSCAEFSHTSMLGNRHPPIPEYPECKKDQHLATSPLLSDFLSAEWLNYLLFLSSIYFSEDKQLF